MAKRSNIEDLYQNHLDTVYKFFYFKSFNQTIAEDLTSQTFLIVLEKFNQPDLIITQPKKFLYGVMRRVWLRFLQEKYRRQEQTLSDIADFETYVHHELERESRTSDEERVKRYIKKLPAAQARVMQLRLIEHRELKEICRLIDKDMNYVKTTQRRGIRNLKQLLANEQLAMENSS